jgi:hypothetical protein
MFDVLSGSAHQNLRNAKRLTQPAADLRESAHFSGLFATLSFFRFNGESTLLPTAANADR